MAAADPELATYIHGLRGKFLPVDEDAGGSSVPMDEKWSQLPKDILWRVLVMVPAAYLLFLLVAH